METDGAHPPIHSTDEHHPPPPEGAAEGKLPHLIVPVPPPPSPRRDWEMLTEWAERWKIQGMPENKNGQLMPRYSEEVCFWSTYLLQLSPRDVLQQKTKSTHAKRFSPTWKA